MRSVVANHGPRSSPRRLAPTKFAGNLALHEKRLKLAVLQLRDDAQRWWRGTSRMLRDNGDSVNVWISAFRKFLLRELNQEKSVRCVEPTKSNAIIGVVTARCERLPLSCENRWVPIIHGPMISRLIGRGIEAT
ncbi:hypothetical protein F511_39155 [Dorcoceras hygrometricum]|uniref:Uncharacterized protein n=1 Tax=Dorcoceras hygrometricum TaxID=472368 RepID=A0A2Z7CYL7_9LAMI|nr:hypothetical protein F511_39155 [Dorcoceras hygrometricum]